MWEAISTAKTNVYFGTYTIEPDAIGERTMEALIAAKKKVSLRLNRMDSVNTVNYLQGGGGGGI